MKYGISVFDLTIRDLLVVAQTADACGFDSIWIGEHLMLPVGYRSRHPTHEEGAEVGRPVVAHGTHLLDPWVSIGAIAQVTQKIEVATGVYLLPLRHPLLTARAAATAQELLGGRLVMGLGTGWLEEEFEAVGVPFAGRGARLDEGISLLRSAWRGGSFTHDGQRFACRDIQIRPEPVDIPLVLGGNSERALRRAASIADGWFGSGTPSLTDAVRLRDRLVELRASQQRPLRCYVRAGWSDREEFHRYHAEGLEDIVVRADELGAGELAGGYEEAIRRAASHLGLRPSPVDAARQSVTL